MRSLTECPLCKAKLIHSFGQALKAISQNSPDDIVALVNCSVCGKFTVSREVVVSAHSTGSHHPKVSAWTRQESEAGRLALVDSHALDNPPKIFDGLSVETRIIRALQTIALKWPVPGTSLELNTAHWPYFCDSGLYEYAWIIGSLSERKFFDGSCVWRSKDVFVAKGSLTAKAWAELEAAKTKYQQHNLCFVAMRFLPELNPLFAAMERACNRAGYVCKRVDTDPHADHIDNRLIDMLNRCRFVIADFTQNSRNVYFEAGYAKGLGKWVIWTKRSKLKVAFDTKQFNFINWHDEDAATFEEELENSIAVILGRLAPIEPAPDTEGNRLRNAPPPTRDVIVTSKGQITLPVEIRYALKLGAGDKIAFEETQPGEFAIKSAASTSASALNGMFGAAETRVSIAAIAERN